MPLTIPNNLNTLLPEPQSPWSINPQVGKRLEQFPGHQFRCCQVLTSDAERDFILRYFMASKPPGYSISKIMYVVNPIHTQAFESTLNKMESEAQNLFPQWRQEPEKATRERAMQRWDHISQLFRPLRTGERLLEQTTVIPLWQGNTLQQCLTICDSGFTDFEKPGALFGNGAYFTDSAHAASLDSPELLLLSWVSISNPYPVVNDQPYPTGGSDMLTLQDKGAYQNYNAHFIPVVPTASGQYYPCYQTQEPSWDKIVVFQASQAVTQFWIELAVDMPQPLIRSTDTEGDLFKQLLQAHESDRFEEQVARIIQIGELYFQRGEWLKIAMILNSALALCQKHLDNSNLESTLFNHLVQCEALFLESKGCKTARINRETLLKYRTTLREIRVRQLNRTDAPIPQIMTDLTQSYRELLGTLIQDLMNVLGPPPVQWACIGLGSMARDEMCPYSDIECAFLIKNETPEALTYFRTLSQLLQIRMVNLGETEFPIFGSLHPSPTPKGYSLDTGGNTPLGKPGVYELIATPQKLADFQTLKWMDDDIILVNALNAVCWVAGERNLVRAYESAKKKKLNQKKEGWFTGIPFRSQLAQRLLEGNLIEFRPELSQSKEDTSAFGIKKELYRPLQSILSSLVLYHAIDIANITKSIEALCQKGILNQEGARHLKEALSTVLTLRFNAHKFYQKEEEYLCHRKVGEPVNPTLLYLEDQQIEILENVYKVLLPLHKCASDALFDPKKWKTCTFYDDGPLARGAALNKSLRYADAQVAYQQAVALNPSDAEALLRLGLAESDLANYNESLRRNLKALELVKQKYGELHPDVATSYGNIGATYNHLGNNDKALEFHLKALKIRLELYGESHPDVAHSYSHVGGTYLHLGENTQALEFLEKALVIWLEDYEKNLPHVAASYNNIGVVYVNLGDKRQALEFHQKALKIRLEMYDENHPDVATSYNNIGAAYMELGDNGKAVEFYRKALEVRLQVYGENHSSVATSYNNTGAAYMELGDNGKALEFCRKALEVRLQVYGENHPDVAQSYNNIGEFYANLGDKRQALEFYQKALEIEIGMYGENRPDVAASYNAIGGAYEELRDNSKALEFYQSALRIELEMYGEDHVDVITSYKRIGAVYADLGNNDYALEFYQKALVIELEMYGENHPHVAISYSWIGAIYSSLGDHNKALEFHLKASEIIFEAHGEHHPNVIASYQNIADVYEKLGDQDKAREFRTKVFLKG